MTLTRETFAAGIKMQRDRLGLTQAEAAALCKVSLRVWSDWEQAKGGEPLYPTMRGVLDILRTTKRAGVRTQKPCAKCGATTGHPSGICVLCQPDWPNDPKKWVVGYFEK